MMNVASTLRCDVVRLRSTDGLELHGLFFRPPDPSPSSGVIHVHGLAGNFYENQFIYALAQHAVRNGIAFLTFNNRGHDYIADVTRESPGGSESVKCGGAFEIFSECVRDIQCAVDFMRAEGISAIALEGHSSGANKAVYYQSSVRHSVVRALVLLSPCDDVALFEETAGERAPQLIELARTMINDGKEDELMPDGSFYSYPMSARTFYENFHASAAQDVFPYRDDGNQFTALAGVDVPLFVTFSKDGDALLIPPSRACEILKAHAKRSPNIECRIIDSASHTYVGAEDRLAEAVFTWLRVKL